MEKLRTVKFSPYRKGMGPTFQLDMFDPNIVSGGKQAIAFKLIMRQDGVKIVLFGRDNMFCSPLYAIDSDEAVKAVMGFVTLRKGDTDSSYFDSYTEAELDFANCHAEALSMAVFDRFGE
jgi:hypothetical protein